MYRFWLSQYTMTSLFALFNSCILAPSLFIILYPGTTLQINFGPSEVK